jgi:beta-glucosidase
MVPDEWKLLYKNTLNQVKQGIIDESRLDDAVRKILTVKFKTGLLDGRKPHEYSSNNIGSVKHRQIARQAVRESMVLLKNNENVLPIQSQKHILVVGEASRNIKNQMGGWTITWQGRDNSNSDFPKTLSIYEAIKSKVESIGGTIEY